MISVSHLLIGLFSGVVTYYITNLFFKPIIQYKEVKSEINFSLIYADKRLQNSIINDHFGKNLYDRSTELSAKLISAYYNLPFIYKKYLSWINEDHSGASILMASLEISTQLNFEEATKIKKMLNLERTDCILISKIRSYQKNKNDN